MGKNDASGCLAHEPVAGNDVDWGAVQRVRVYGRCKDWEARKDDQTGPKRPAMKECGCQGERA